MKILICSDGSEQADSTLKFGALIAAGNGAAVTLLGVVENAGDEGPLLDALKRGMEFARGLNVNIELLTKSGDPVAEIKKHTAEKAYDLVLIGAVYKGHAGPFIMSVKAYKLIKIIGAPVLVVVGKRPQLKKVLICSGGRSYIDKAINLTVKVALPLGATVTLFHVLPEAPAMYDNIMERTEDAETLLASNSMLGLNLRREKELLEKAGVKTEVMVRYGDVTPEILEQIRVGDYDLIVTGSSPMGGAVHTYLMGDVTSEIVNRSQRPVLVVRGSGHRPRGIFALVKRLFGRGERA
ncbi:MAG: universal stress protein [Chthoniobacteraceae bacterium]